MQIFTSLKPIIGRAALVQSVSLMNWRKRFGVEVRNVLPRNKSSLCPTFNEVVRQAVDGGDEVCLYANADILFAKDVSLVVEWCKSRTEDFLVIGRRTDMLANGGRILHRPSGMDYFFFRKGMFLDMPETIVGRAYYDSAILAYCMRKGILVIDATEVLTVLHQWHDYAHVKNGWEEVFAGIEAQANKVNNRLRNFGPHIADVKWKFCKVEEGICVVKKRVPILRRTRLWWLWNLLTRGGKY